MIREQSASMEDYLEAVQMLGPAGGTVRVKEISALLGVKMPSVTAAMKRLADNKLVIHERYGRVRLTPAGEKAASEIFRRHEVLRKFLIQVLDVDPQTAAEDACRMEHAVSPHTMDRLTRFLSFVESYPRKRIHWLAQYRRGLQDGGKKCQA